MTRARALVQKPTLAQQIRRADAVVKMTKEGYAATQIAAALQISISTVTNDRNQRYRELQNAPKTVPQHRRLPDPEPVDWVSDPPAGSGIPPSYVTGSPIPRIKGTLDFLREANARARFAFNIADAEAEGDEEYLVGAQVAIADLIAYLQDLQKIAQDPKAADSAKKTGRDDVQALDAPQALDAKTRQSLAQARRLPPQGAGIIPGRMYAYLWSIMWAGLPLDERAIAKVASREGNPNLARVRAAAKEMKAAFGLDE